MALTDNVIKEEEEVWDLEIRPKSKFFDLNLKEIWRYRDLLWLFVRRDFSSQYKQTILGPLWHFVQPILMTLMFMLVFGRIAHIPTDGIQPILFYMTGITVWNYFSTCLTTVSSTFVTNAGIFGKVYFPRMVIPLSVVISNLVRFGIQFLLLLTVMIWYHFNGTPIGLSWYWLMIIPLMAAMAGIGLGVGIIFSSMTSKYRDLTILLTFAIQLAMYATPVVYPMSFIKGNKFEWIIQANPLSPLLEAFRYSLFQKGTFDIYQLAYSGGFMLMALLIGFISFNKVEKSFMDTV